MKIYLFALFSVIFVCQFQSVYSQISPNLPKETNLGIQQFNPHFKPTNQSNTKDCQNITINNGWNIISTYINPQNPAVDSVFAPIINSLILVKDGNGHVFWPATSFNNIGNMTIGKGYFVKVSTTVTLPVYGTAVVPETTPIQLYTGWNLVGYLRQSTMNATAALTSIISSVTLVKNDTGQVYWPLFQLGEFYFYNGEGYLIRICSSCVLMYPPN